VAKRDGAEVKQTALVDLATLTLPAQAQSQPQPQSQAVAKSDSECRLSKNGEVIYNDDCTVKEKVSEGRESFVVRFDTGKIYRFSGPNRQNLRIEDDFANTSNVLFEDKGSKGVFSWNDGNSTYKLAVKTGPSSSGGIEGTLTYMLDKKRCVAFLSANNTYKAITFADESKCQR
jgi:hypothetical protein